jgi:hypothetical protein
MQLQAVQVPTCAQIEFKGLIAVAGRVKLGPILQGAHVVHCTHTPTRAQEALKLNTMTAREPIDVSRRGCSTRTRESWAGTWQAGTPRHEPLRAEARGGGSVVLLRRCGPAATSAALTPHFVARLGLLPAGARLDDLLFHAAIRLRGDTRGGGGSVAATLVNPHQSRPSTAATAAMRCCRRSEALNRSCCRASGGVWSMHGGAAASRGARCGGKGCSPPLTAPNAFHHPP